MDTCQIRILHLKKGDDKRYECLHLKKGQVLRFLQDSTLQNLTVRLFINHPLTPTTPFHRHTFHELLWQCSTKMCLGFTDLFAEINISHAGSFSYYFTVNDSAVQSHAEGKGYFLVEPVLQAKGYRIPLDGICMQTVITKLLGPFAEWECRLRVTKESGYNMVHFTPVQELGKSKSAYCIKDHHRLSPAYSTDKRLTYLMMPHLKGLVEKMEQSWQMLSMVDVVFNHTAADCTMLERYPQCAYNLRNCPYLKPAYLLDQVLQEFSQQVGDHRWENQGIPACLSDQSHLDAMRYVLHCEVLPKYRLTEFYLCHIDRVVAECKQAALEGTCEIPSGQELTLVQDPEFRRLHTSVNVNMAVKWMFERRSKGGQHGDHPVSRSVPRFYEDLDRVCNDLRNHLTHLNQEKDREVMEHLHVAIENFIANARYRFVNHQGERLGHVSKECPIMLSYFHCPESHKVSVEVAETMMKKEPELIMAVNGFVLDGNRLRNYTEDHLAPESNIYLRRELVAWRDTIKLRYGQKAQDCPVLWEYMQSYMEMTGKIFHGVRLDSMHCTPLHVAEHMLDVARRQRPDLYVLAELSTGDEKMDRYFINRLGINALVGQLENANSPEDMKRMVADFSEEPLGSFVQPRIRALLPSKPPVMFYDMTHDNESPITDPYNVRWSSLNYKPLRFKPPNSQHKRSEYGVWPSAAVTAMSRCAIGSNRGYDELVPHKICALTETRLYSRWAGGCNSGDSECVDFTTGICKGKQLLNLLHHRMALEGYTEVHMVDLQHGVVEITRHNPNSHQSVVLVVSLVFQKPQDPNIKLFCNPTHVEGVVDEVLIEGNVVQNPWQQKQYSKSATTVNGLPNLVMDIRDQMHISRSLHCKEKHCEDGVSMDVCFSNFTPGTVIALLCSISDKAKQAVDKIQRSLGQYAGMIRSYTGMPQYAGSWETSTFKQITAKLSSADLNRVLYRVGVEEESDGFGVSTYNLPHYGNFCYCGLRGVMSALGEVRGSNNTGHPLCDNLRQGPWLMDYIVHRLHLTASTRPLGDWLEDLFGLVKEIPQFLVPRYFDIIISSTYIVLREQALNKFSLFVKDGSTFVQALALSYIQFLGYVRKSRLPPLSPHLFPAPRSETFLATGETEQAPVSLSSGLPHFAVGKWRCWGRGTFIALRGMMLITGRFADARSLILAYGGALRHGLIPNLLHEGRKARYNCRDAVWWWLHAIKAYTLIAPDGESILQDPVLRLYPSDDAPYSPEGYCEQPLHAVMQEALSRHMAGVPFRERGAGADLDPYMTHEGFNVSVGVVWPQGYVCGGSVHNCGTWMDFMGKSRASNTWGKPATPRDGSAVEMVGLCMAIVTWLAELSLRDVYPYPGVRRSTPDWKDELITFEQWGENIKENFEKDFYISPTPQPDSEPDSVTIRRRGIYKDCLHSFRHGADYQLRPNFCVAMVVAPELFDDEKAWGALEVAQQALLGYVGMKTLDPQDPSYCGFYSVGADCNNPIIADGYNYHNGPEHLWMVAYFLRAKLHFASRLEEQEQRRGVLKETIALVRSILSRHYQLLFDSPWKALPQLTNENGAFCEDSCRAQATSSACVLELLYDVERMSQSPKPASVDLQGPLCMDTGLP